MSEPARSTDVALTYGQKLIAEAIEAHFGERIEEYDEDVDDTSNHDAWEAFDTALARISRAPIEAVKPVAWRWKQRGRTDVDAWQYQHGHPQLPSEQYDTDARGSHRLQRHGQRIRGVAAKARARPGNDTAR